MTTQTENTGPVTPAVSTVVAPVSAAGNPAAGVALVVGTLALIYMISQFLRNSVGVIAPDLAREIGLTASEIGVLSSAFFISFALAQLPLGIALDRFGPRRCMLVCAGIVVVAAGLFAGATTPLGLITGRVLLGLGSSCYLMAPLALYARRYRPDRFAMLAGVQLGVGSVGTLIATAPLAYSTAAIGWRMTFVVVGALMLAGAVAIALVVRDDPGDKDEGEIESVGASIAGIVAAMRAPSVWRLFLMHLTGYSSFTLVVGLWGGPYLTHVYGYDLRGRGDVLLIAAIAQVAALFVWGPSDRWLRSYKIPVMVGALTTALGLGLAAVLGKFGTWPMLVWFAVLGAFAAYTPVLIAHGKALFEPHLVGRGLTILNMGTMAGVFVTQAVSGLVMDMFASKEGVYPLEAYQAMFGLQAVIVILACLTYLGARDPWRS